MFRNARTLLLLLAAGLALGAMHSAAQEAVEASAPPAAAAAERPGAGPASEPLPASLQALYPPKAAQPVYLGAMVRMSHALGGIMVDLMEGDLANVQGDFETFQTQYLKTRELVPEWADRFPAAPVENLGAALATGDQAKVMAAMQGLGPVCMQCHEADMPRVQQLYHWRNFHELSVEDPVTRQAIGFGELMHYLDAGLTGIAHNLGQGQTENAGRSLEGFRARFDALAASCGACHDTERAYFVDTRVRGMIDRLGATLAAEHPDPNEAAALAQGIGMESCHKCHLVHVPAAFAQARARREASPPLK